MTDEFKTILVFLAVMTVLLLVSRFGGALGLSARTVTARCRDGSLSSSRCRRGTCSRHGGVATWLTAV